MDDLLPPFQFDVSELVGKYRRDLKIPMITGLHESPIEWADAVRPDGGFP